ncbi:DUF4142 domain-containing protein [Rufibacter soli]
MKNLKRMLACMGSLLMCALVNPEVQAQGTTPLSDPEVASVAVIANKIDIAYAKIAKEKSKNKQVLEFAQTMTNDHTAVIDQAVALVKKLGVTPKDNAVGKKMLADAEKTKASLRTKSGSAFDKAYIDNEVTYHKAVISAVKNLLIPESENAELKALLQGIVPALQTHLEHAQMVQKQFKSK